MYLKIQTKPELLELIDVIENSSISWLAFDTEFFRETTYYPVLSLIQIATASQVWVIDALMCDDLTPLKSILENPKIKKIFHAGDQDWGILKQYTGAKTWPYFDTQFMAAFAKLGHSSSLETLVLELLNEQVNKSCQKTDWIKRPLTDEQLAYAAKDAEFVASIYPILTNKINDLQRMVWVEEEMQSLFHKYEHASFSKDWLKLCVTGCKWPIHFYAFELAKWREDWAKKLDLPRRHVLTDIALEQVLQKNSVDHIEDCDCLSEVHADLKIVWQNLQENPVITGDRRAQLEQMVNDHHQVFSKEHRQLIKDWQLHIKVIAGALEIPAFLLVNKQLLQQLARGDNTSITGWRLEYLNKVDLWKNLAQSENKDG